MNIFSHISARGFTLFFAMLVGSLALAVGLAIYDLTVRELQLSAVATQSQYAVYAADTGAECALYWDSKCSLAACPYGSAFATSSSGSAPGSGVICNGQDMAAAGTPGSPATPWAIAANASAATTTFTMYVSSQSQTAATTTCALVVVGKSGNPARTSIISHGYNTCIAGSLQVERVFQVSY